MGHRICTEFRLWRNLPTVSTQSLAQKRSPIHVMTMLDCAKPQLSRAALAACYWINLIFISEATDLRHWHSLDNDMVSGQTTRAGGPPYRHCRSGGGQVWLRDEECCGAVGRPLLQHFKCLEPVHVFPTIHTCDSSPDSTGNDCCKECILKIWNPFTSSPPTTPMKQIQMVPAQTAVKSVF